MAYGKYMQRLDADLIKRKDIILADAQRLGIKPVSMEKMCKTVGRNHDVSDGIILLRYLHAQVHNLKK